MQCKPKFHNFATLHDLVCTALSCSQCVTLEVTESTGGPLVAGAV